MKSLLEATSPTAKKLLATPATRTTVLCLLDHHEEVMRHYLFGHGGKSDDLRLQVLTTLVGTLAGSLSDADWSRSLLRKIFGYTAGWIAASGERAVQMAINAERERQDQLLREGKFLFNCTSRVVDPKRKLRVLVEEQGEVAEAIDYVELFATRPHSVIKRSDAKAQLTTELIQVAAVAVGWLESFETN